MQLHVNKSILKNTSVNVVFVFSCRQAKGSPSSSPHCLTLRWTSSSSDMEGTLDMSLGLCSESACSPRFMNSRSPHHFTSLSSAWMENSSSEQRKGWQFVCLSWMSVSRLLGVLWRRFSDLYLNCFSITTRSSVSPHKTVQTGAGRRSDARSKRRPLNIFCFVCFIVGDFAEYRGDISFIVERSREETNPVCFCCRLTKRIKKTILPRKANLVLGTTAWIHLFF